MAATRKENPFFEEVYSIVSQIPKGWVLSYGMVAALAGKPRNARMVGQAMWGAPQGRGIPCHRVVNSGGGTAPVWPQQRRLLEQEGVTFTRTGNVDMKRHIWNFDEDII